MGATIQIRDAATGSAAWIAPEIGFNCFRFQAVVDGQPVEVLDALEGFENGTQRPSSSGIPILFPFPNRIRGGKFNWNGRDYQLPVSDKFGNAIHGFVLDRPWRVIAQGEDFVTGEFQLSVDAPDRRNLWPADFVIEVDYELIGNRLRMNVRIANPSECDLPWGLGTHPYFKAPLATSGKYGDCLIEVPAAKQWILEDCLPTGTVVDVLEGKDLREGEYLSVLQLDDVYTGLEVDGPQFDTLVVDEGAGLQIVQTCPPIFREIVCYTPGADRGAVAVEPYTCATDAINLSQRGVDAGWRTLGPGAEFHTWIDISVGKVLA